MGPRGRITAWVAAHPFRAVFGAALAVRLGYVGFVWAVSGLAGFQTDDSAMYLALGAEMAAGEGELGLRAERMPLYTAFVALHVLIAGGAAPLAVALSQAVVDAATCVVAAALGGRIAPGLRLPAGLAAAVFPTMVVVSAVVLTDTLFTAFAALALLAAARWLERMSRADAWVLGLALAGAAATRAVILPWAAALLAGLALVALVRGAAPAVLRLVLAAAVLAAPLAAVAAYNGARHDAFALTSQTGTHLLGWVVPLVIEARDGTPHAEGAARMNRLFERRHPDAAAMDPFARSRAQAALAAERLAELGPGPAARAWAVGAAINLFAPAVTQAPPAARLPRTGFYDTPGATKLDKVWAFLFRNDNPLYAWLLLVGAAGTAAVRAVQGIGLIDGWRRYPHARLLLFGLAAWVVYLLVVSGPIAAPKYRLPAEPALAVFFALGLARLRSWLGSRARRPEPPR